MNIDLLTDHTNGTLAHYLAFAMPMTAVTIWVIMAFQYRKKDPNHLIHDENHVSMWSKLSWPLSDLLKEFKWGRMVKTNRSSV